MLFSALLVAVVTTTAGKFSDVSFGLQVVGEKAVFDFVVEDGDPAEAIAAAQKLADAGKEVWRADGIEMLIGNPEARVQFAFDFLGRTYTDTAGADPECVVTVEGTVFRVRCAVPLSVLPRCADCDLQSRANFLRKKRKHVQAWKPGFGPMEKAGVIAYAPVEAVKAYKMNRARVDKHAANIDALRRKATKGIRALPQLAEAETMTKVPEAWRPAKTFGKDYRFLLPSRVVGSFEGFALTNSALFADSMFWTQWRHCVPQAYQPEGYVAKLLDRYPDKPFAINGGDVGIVGKLPPELKATPEVQLFFDKHFMDSLFDRWDARFVGFTESEAFANGSGKFRTILDLFGWPVPKTREEAYRYFCSCYHYQTNDVPNAAPFRHMANVSPYVRGRYSNASAPTFNQFIAAQGDRMTGNETGDCMGPQAEKFAFARGSARQFGIPWRNYQTYYSWSVVETPEGVSGGVRTVYAYDELVSPKCRKKKYCHLNSPTWGTDKPRRKNYMFHPYFSGASVWSSEAIEVELFGHFDEEEIKTADPAVVALRDVKTYPSPLLKDHMRFWDEIVRKRDRGVQVTPIAFVWDRAHGYAPLYFYNRVWDFLPPSELEKGMWATCRHVFRCNTDNSSCDTSPWGDVFDMVTNDADADFLANYRVLWPVGDVTLDGVFAAKVREAVRRGATFVVNAELLARYPKAFDTDFLGCQLTGGEGRSPSTWLVGEKREVVEKYIYNYRKIAAVKSQVLAVTTDGTASPAVTLKRYGKGRVLVTTPANLKVPGSFTTMLNLFDVLMTKVRADVLPIRVETTAEYGIAFNGRSWVFHLNNNAGATPRNGRSPQPLETDVSKTANVKILMPESLGLFTESLDWWTGERKALVREKVDGRWYRVFQAVLPGGDSALVEFVPPVVETARKIPVAGEYDVVVVGGTAAGVATALAAQKAGAKVFLAAGYPYLGEDMASTLELGDPDKLPRTALARRLWMSETDKATFTYTYDRKVAAGPYAYENDADSRVAESGFPQTPAETTVFNEDVTYSCRLERAAKVSRVEVIVAETPEEWFDAAKRPKKGMDSILAQVKDVTLTVTEGDAKGKSFPLRRVASVRSGGMHYRQKANMVTLAVDVDGRVAAADVKFRLADGAREVCVSRIWFHLDANDLRPRRPTPLKVKQALDVELLSREIPFLTASPATDLLRDGEGNVAGVVIANRSGRQAVKAKCVVDATRYATLSRLACGVEGLKGPTRFTRMIITNGTDLVRIPLTIDMPDGSFRSFARAEWEARERTWSHLTLDDADEMLLVDRLPKPMMRKGLVTVDGQLALDARIAAGTAAGRTAAAFAKGRRALKNVTVEGCECTVDVGSKMVNAEVKELLGGLRAYRGGLVGTVPSPTRTLPILATCDVVVAGGGTSGASAAVGAAKAGATTIVVEWLHVLGGVGTDGMIVSYCAGNNRGFSRRFQNVERRRGAVHVHPETRNESCPDPDPTKRARTSYYQRTESWREECRKYGVEVWFGTMAEGAYVVDGKVAGIVVVTPFGRGVILAKATVDATGNADVAAAAGAETEFISRDELMLQSAGQAPHRIGKNIINTDFGFVNDADAWDLWLFGVRARAGALDAWDLQKLPDSRERRHIIPDYAVSGEDVVSYRKFSDTIVQPYAPQDAHGPLLEDFCYLSSQSDNVVWNRVYSNFHLNVPLRSLLPRGLGGIIVVGTGAGCSRDVMPMVRMQSDLMNMGFAAGFAAAMASDGDFRKIDIAALKKRLIDEGVLEPAVVGWTDEPDLTSDTVVAAAVRTMADAFKGSDIVLRRENRAKALPHLRTAWRDARTPEAKLIYAETLGFLGDATGVDTLVEAVRGKIDLEKIHPVRRFGDRVDPMDGCLIALGRTRSPKALEPLLRQVAQMDAETTFAKMRGAMLALKALGDPRAAKPLAELLRKPGIGGHAVREASDLGPTGGYGPDFEMHRCLRELAIARALLESGDCEGLGRRTFESYRDDPRGTLSEYASQVLAGM